MRFAALSALLLAFLFATNIYRAATQSITIDEALTYHEQAQGSTDTSPFNNNLNAWLCNLSTRLFGVSELAMRLPSLLGGALYFVSLFRLCLLLFGDSPWLLLAVALNSWNPFLLDYLSAARGYGMGIAFWTLGAFYAVRYLDIGSGDKREFTLLLKMAIALGLAVTSHVTEMFGAVALAASLAALLLTDSLIARNPKDALHFLVRRVVPLLLLLLLVAAPVLWPALRDRRIDRVDAVGTGYWKGLRSLVNACLLYKSTLLTRALPLWRLLDRRAWWLLLALFAGLAVAAAWISRLWLRRGRLGELSLRQRVLLLFSLALLLTFLLLWIEPRVFHHGYFGDRRLLFTAPPIFISCSLWLRELFAGAAARRALSIVGAAMAALLAINFALEFNVRYYLDWEFDAATRQAAAIIAQRRPRDSSRPVQVGANWLMRESLNFYRVSYGLDWVAEVTRDSPACTYDYYYVLADDLASLSRFGLEEIFRDRTARTVLAMPGVRARQREAALREAGFSGRPDCAADVMVDTSWTETGKPGSQRHLLRDFMEALQRPWTFARPALLFYVPRRSGVRFKMDFVIASHTFKETGPQRLTVWLNGRQIGQKLYRAPGEHTFEQEIAPEWLRSDGIALVETTLDKYYVAPDDGQKLGYLFVRGGFQ